MRTDEAQRQMSELEKVLAKFLQRFAYDTESENADLVLAMSNALLEAYNLGAVEAAGAIPHEVRVYAQTDSPSAEDVNKALRMWPGAHLVQIIPTMVPKMGQHGPKAERVPGFALWMQRQCQPQKQESNAESAAT